MHFLILSIFIALTPKINTFLMATCKKENARYIEESCVFIFFFWAVPLIIQCVCLLLCVVYDIVIQYIEEKRKQSMNANKNSSTSADAASAANPAVAGAADPAVAGASDDDDGATGAAL